MSLKTWWKELWLEQYQIIITVPAETVIHADGARTETTKKVQYSAKKIIKAMPKQFIFIDLKGRRNDIKFLNPVDFHIIKIW